MKAYRIKDWKTHFEVAQTRKCRTMQWVAVPNRHDGCGYALVMAHERGLEIFAAWVLMLEVASKMPTRGLLVNGKPLTAANLAIRTRVGKKDVFELAFKVLCDKEIGWLEEVEWERTGSGLVAEW